MEPIVASVAEEVVFPALPEGGVVRGRIQEYARSKFPGSKSVSSMSQAIVRTYERFGIGTPTRTRLNVSLREGSLAAFTYLLHLEFPEPGMYSFERLFNGPMHKWLLWDQQWMVHQLYVLREAGILSKVSEIDRTRQFTTNCEKILKTLFLYHVAKMQPNGLSVEEIMNSVMEWVDHDKGQKADTKDNLDHYEVLLDELAKELPQVKKVGKNFVFTPEGGGGDVKELFQKARSQAENSQVQQRVAWHQLLGLDGWEIKTSHLTMDLARSTRSILRGIAPAEQKDVEVEWHGRTIKGRVYRSDLLDIASRGQALPPLNTADTDHDFAVFIGNRPCGDKVTDLAKKVGDRRILFWSPAQLTAQEKDRLLDFAAYRELVKDHQHKETEDAKEVIQWVANPGCETRSAVRPRSSRTATHEGRSAPPTIATCPSTARENSWRS
jgi:hypothetical protein